MDKLIELLPQLIIYIILGFIFLRVFRYMCTIKNSVEYEHIVWESLLVGYILKQCYDMIPSVNYVIDILGMIIATLVISTLFAKVYSSKALDKFLKIIGIHRTRNKYLWKDIEDSEYRTMVDAVNPDTNEAYHGVVVLYEEFKEHPQIVLSYYKYYKDWHTGEAYFDFSDDPSKIVIVDTLQFSRISIEYDQNSSKIKRILEVDASKKNKKQNLLKKIFSFIKNKEVNE